MRPTIPPAVRTYRVVLEWTGPIESAHFLASLDLARRLQELAAESLPPEASEIRVFDEVGPVRR